MKGTCACGCGEQTRIAARTDSAKGWVRGEPLKYIFGHNQWNGGPEYEINPDTGCWEWVRALDVNGYGRNGATLAHRMVYTRERGPIPEGLHLDHLCRNTLCVNPDHLEPVTNAVNSRRGNMTRLTWADVHEIRESDEPHVVTAKRYGVHPVHIGQIRAGKAWVAA